MSTKKQLSFLFLGLLAVFLVIGTTQYRSIERINAQWQEYQEKLTKSLQLIKDVDSPSSSDISTFNAENKRLETETTNVMQRLTNRAQMLLLVLSIGIVLFVVACLYVVLDIKKRLAHITQAAIEIGKFAPSQFSQSH